MATQLAALHSFGLPAFRRLWLAAVLSAFSTWADRLAVGWFVLDTTGSVFLAALSFAVRTAPFMIFGPLSGTFADRVERRRLLTAAALIKGGFMAAVGLLIVSGVDNVWPIIALVALSGAVHTFEITATQALITDIVGRSAAINGIGLHSVGVRSVGVVGALLGGVTIEFLGAGVVFLAGAAPLAVAAWAFWTVRAAPLTRTGGTSFLDDVLDGFRIVLRVPAVATLLGLAVAVEILAFSYQSLLPGIAKEVLDVGPVGLGALTFAAGVGSVLGSAALSQLGGYRRKGLLVVGVIFALGAWMLGLSAFDVMTLALLLVGGLGATTAVFDALQWTLLQAEVPDELRGRVIGFWAWAVGFGWIGPIVLGGVSEMAGIPEALAGSGSLLLVLGVVAAVWASSLRQAEPAIGG